MAENLVDTLKQRYKDAYAVADASVSTGSILKIIGLIIAIVITVYAFYVGGIERELDIVFIATGLASAAGVWGFVHSIGVNISAQGQALKASLDSAVNSSPFLTDIQKAEIMSLPTDELHLAEYRKQKSPQ